MMFIITDKRAIVQLSFRRLKVDFPCHLLIFDRIELKFHEIF